MPTRNVNLTDELDAAVERRVKSGKYSNASEVMRAALRALDVHEEDDAAKMRWLRKAIQQGLDSGIYQGDPIENIRKRLNLPKL